MSINQVENKESEQNAEVDWAKGVHFSIRIKNLNIV